MKPNDITSRDLLVICVGLLAWLAGFMTAVMLFSGRVDADAQTPRDQQIQRYEASGR